MRVLMPVPDRDFDVTEVAVPWHVLTAAGHEVVFASERAGASLTGDPKLLTGVIFGQLGAEPEPRQFYREMTGTAPFQSPIAWADLRPDQYDGLILPGGHAPGMRQYLDNSVLRDKIAKFWALHRPVGAICHGVLVLARTLDPMTGRSLIADRRTTCLPRYLEGPIAITRGTTTDSRPAFVVEDGNYLSASWPGDAYLFARKFLALLDRDQPPSPTA
ncbi:MAG: thiamine biosynthesis protein ThiJ [Actinobacteria bacterium]|nr:MAG: thiamine biosynthesis protein ThiJ [Actinomycetota bacterium]